MKRALAAVVLAGLAAIGAGAAEEGGGPPAPAPAPAPEEPKKAPEEPPKAPEPPPPPVDPAVLARREEKARKLLAASGWLEQTKTSMLSLVDGQEEKGLVPKGTAENFRKIADWDALLKAAVASYARNVDEKAMDAAIVFYESPEGKRFSEQQPSMVKAGAIATRDFTVETTSKAVAAAGKANLGDKAKGLLDRIKGKKPEENEKAAIEVLHRIVEGQVHMHISAMIDADRDGIGEHGTLMELSGATPLRRGVGDFSKQDEKPLADSLIPGALGKVDGDGILEINGYLFRVYLPATGGESAGFVHESGTPKDPAFAGDGAAVGVDLAERFCFLYAWPAERGKSGNRAFSIHMAWDADGVKPIGSGKVLASANEKAQWSGKAKAPPGYAALLGDTATSAPAVGTVGRDGDVWKAAE